MTRNNHGGSRMDDVNATLLIAALETEGMIEPCDECDSHPLDWMDAVGIDLSDEIWPYGEWMTDECV